MKRETNMVVTQIAVEASLQQTIIETIQSIWLSSKSDYLLAPATNDFSDLPMPTLLSSVDSLENVAPFTYANPVNAATVTAKVIRYQTKARLMVLLRPCEIRALIELVKLNQCDLQNVLIVSFVCPGRVNNQLFLGNVEQTVEWDHLVSDHCKSCVENVPSGADYVIESKKDLIEIQAMSPKAVDGLKETSWSLKEVDIESKKDELDSSRVKVFESIKRSTAEKIKPMDRFQSLMANCILCQNCRSVCPVCYCKECVFQTDVFSHDPETLMRKATKNTQLRLPNDTIMAHLTRLAHMAHACVGCGQCTAACPNDIPVADIFRTVGSEVQDLFEYRPGEDVNQPIPYLLKESTTCHNQSNRQKNGK